MALHGLYYPVVPPGPPPLIANKDDVMTSMTYSRTLNSFGFPPSFVDEELRLGIYDTSMETNATGPIGGGQMYQTGPFQPNVYIPGPVGMTAPVIVSFINGLGTTGPTTYSNADAVTIDIPTSGGPLVLAQIAPIIVPGNPGFATYMNAWVAPDGSLWQHSLFEGFGGAGFLSGPFAFMAGPQL